MKIQLYQIIVVAISAFMLFQGTKNYLKKQTGQTFLKLTVRIIVWGGMSLIALFPGFTNLMASVVGLKGNVNAVILTAFLLIFLMIFKLLSAIERIEQQMSEIIRKEALSDVTTNEKK